MYSLKNPFVNELVIAQLIEKLGLILSAAPTFVIDSRKVVANCIFCAYPGTVVDGRAFIPEAVGRGASLILWEADPLFNSTEFEVDLSGTQLLVAGLIQKFQVAQLPIKHLQQLIGIIAALSSSSSAAVSADLECTQKIFAITGTNGKTSISHWLNQAYRFLGEKSAIIGTTGSGIYPQGGDVAANAAPAYAVSSTTPDPITLQHLLEQFKEKQAAIVAMEVSSHALDQGRVNGVKFTSAIFTNLTQDHLDYHKTLDNYFAAKKQLFYWQGLEHAIINEDDLYGKQLLAELAASSTKVQVLTYGIDNGILRATNLHLSARGCTFDLLYYARIQTIRVAVIGRFNIYNILAVAGTLLLNGIAWERIAPVLARLKPVTGRMDAQIVANQPLMIVDYAHTPDALEQTLLTLQELKGLGKLYCVFGCGGNRDTSKRPIMGQIAAKYADLVIVTSDNPRYEDPQEIMEQIVSGITTANYLQKVDRKQAIIYAYGIATNYDIILIAGKGHENYQEIMGQKHHFSDQEIVTNLLSKGG